jgi:ribonuclease J
MSMRVRIHRGSHEIGGNCVEVESGGARIVLDLGRPLDAGPDDDVPLPPISGLDGNDPSLLGLLVSHPHQDHYGLASQVSPKVPVFIGEAASRILHEAAFFGCAGLTCAPAGLLRHQQPFDLGPFRITPFLVGRRLFYTGDFRATGAKAALFRRLLERPPAPVDVLLMEGTNVRGDAGPRGGCRTEAEVRAAMAQTIGAARGLVLVAYSGQNIDRLVSVFSATRKARRELVLDLYTAVIAVATGNPKIPQPGFGSLRVFVPQSQRRRVLESRRFDYVRRVKKCRLYEQHIAARADRLVVTFRKSIEPMLDALPSALKGAVAIWSQWPGYLDMPSGAGTREFCRRHGIPLIVHHTSGHASIADLQRLAGALKPGRVVPIHTTAPGLFVQYFKNVAPCDDGVWWEI